MEVIHYFEWPVIQVKLLRLRQLEECPKGQYLSL